MPSSAKPETTRVVDMQYCGVCKCPYEFCEWGPLLPKCKEKITASWDDIGLKSGVSAMATDLWTGENLTAVGSISASVASHDSAVYRLVQG